MTQQQKCIFVTGPGHSATRLLVQLFHRHPDVSVPMNSLNTAAEFLPIHRFFISAMDHTRLHSKDYAIDRGELKVIMDAYRLNIDPSKKFMLFKLPYYPLLCLDFFTDYFGGEVAFLYCKRPTQKIVKSFLDRGEDQLFFHQGDDEILRQVKKLPTDRRAYYLASADAPAFFAELVQECDRLRRKWDDQNPNDCFIEVDVEELTKSVDYLDELLVKLGLDTQYSRGMLDIVDSERLLRHRHKGVGIGRLRKIAGQIPGIRSVRALLRRSA